MPFIKNPVVHTQILYNDLPVVRAKDVWADVNAGKLAFRSIGRHLPLDLANSYHCPIGEQVGRGWLFMQRRHVEKLDSNEYYLLRFQSGDVYVEFPRMYFLRAYRIAMGPSHDPNALYLVEIADSRWLLRKSTIEESYNVRPRFQDIQAVDPSLLHDDFMYLTTNTYEERAWTWKEVAEDIWTESLKSTPGYWEDLLGTWIDSSGDSRWPGDALANAEVEPAGTPENLIYSGVSAWHAINDFVNRVGMQVRYDPIYDVYDIVQMGFGTASLPGVFDWETRYQTGGGVDIEKNFYPHGETQHDINLPLMEDEEVHQSINHLPEYVDVVFPANYASCLDSVRYAPRYTYQVQWSDITGQLNDDHELLLLDRNISMDTRQIIHDPMHALFDEDNEFTPTNLSALEERAEEIAYDYYRINIDMAPARWVYSGPVEALPGPYVKEVRWRDLADGMKTEVLREPICVECRDKFHVPDCPGGSGGGGKEIRFQICEACCDECWADVVILSKNFTGSAPGAGGTERECGDGYGEEIPKELPVCQVRVYDVLGCMLNEPDDNLIDRKGYASYMSRDSSDCDCDDLPQEACGGFDIPETRWEITTLCPPEWECSG